MTPPLPSPTVPRPPDTSDPPDAPLYVIGCKGKKSHGAVGAVKKYAGMAQAETTLALSFGIGTIDVHGDTAAAEIDQHWVRRQRKAGALRLVDTRDDL